MLSKIIDFSTTDVYLGTLKLFKDKSYPQFTTM